MVRGGDTVAKSPPGSPRVKGPFKLLTSTAGVVSLSALLLVSSGVAYVVSQSSANTIGVVQVFITLTGTETTAPAEFAGNSVQVPHCSVATFDAASRRLTVSGAAIGAEVRNVVLIHYTGMILNFGGDNTQVTYLTQGAQADVNAAYNEQVVLYSLAPGTRTPFIPGRVDLSAPLTVEASYTVQNTGNFTFGFYLPSDKNLTVTENHRIESFGGVQVTSEGGGFCM